MIGYLGVMIVLAIVVALGKFMISDLVRIGNCVTKYKVDFSDKQKRMALPVIKLKIGNSVEYFLIDSGSNRNLISSDFAAKLGGEVDEGNTSSINGTTGAIKAFGTEFNLSYKKTDFGMVKFGACDIEALDQVRDHYNINIVGIIGSKFMEKYRWSIDFDELVIWIKK